jgi:DeoR family ulaG and ulaABCDEF operon transcriptional repressor
MFMSVYGLSLLGLMEADPLLIQAEKRLISQAEELIVLADSSKFSKRAGLILCGLNRVSTVITDTDASDSAVQLLEQSGVRVVTVAPEALPQQSLATAAFNPAFDYPAAGLFQAEVAH